MKPQPTWSEIGKEFAEVLVLSAVLFGFLSLGAWLVTLGLAALGVSVSFWPVLLVLLGVRFATHPIVRKRDSK